jgi:site-specific DNA-methyltransferase (adenine-specific)
MKKSSRNKTIDFTLEEGKKYFDRCISTKDIFSKNIINKTINSDTFNILEKMPKNIVDLVIVDPPYNLSKNYNGTQFRKTDNKNYAKYTEKYLNLIKPLLKQNATIYVCCDWKTSLVIGNILPKYFIVQNRISWQREKGKGAKKN